MDEWREWVAEPCEVASDKSADGNDRYDALLTIRMANDGQVPVEPRSTAAVRNADVPEVWYSDEVVRALLTVATDLAEPGGFQDEAGEALSYVWINRDRFDAETFEQLTPTARLIAGGIVRLNRPEWLTASDLAE